MCVKEYIKNIIIENLENFEVDKGGKQRTIGDLYEQKVCDIFLNNNDSVKTVIKSRGKKSIEDISLIIDGITYYVDPKTHDIDADFSMPNLSAIEKIKKLFFSDNTELIYVFIHYDKNKNMVTLKDIDVHFIWELDNSILGVGALGKGQLQLKNANNKLIITSEGKEEWFKLFKKSVLKFLDKQIIKINKQILEWQ